MIVNTQQMYRNLFSALSLIALFAAAQLSVSANAEEKNEASKSSMKVEDAKKGSAQIATEEDPDDLITNAKMRAESGSKSKYSISMSMNYSGGTLTKPLAENRPNIAQGAALTEFASLDGSVAAKRTLTKADSMLLGVGVRMVTPFQKQVPEGAGQRFNANDPYITYQRLSNLGGVQSVFTVGPTYYTSKDVKAVGYVGDFSLGETLAYDFGGSRFTLGASAAAVARGFNKATADTCKSGEDEFICGQFQKDYSFGLYPFAEFQINDKIGLRTLTGLYVYDHKRTEDRALTFTKNTIYQSVGVGISVTRDIYLYPNVQFIPEDNRSDRTNVALNTSINLF